MVDESIHDSIAGINGRLGGKIKLAIVPIADIDLLKKNARFMKHEQFQRLVENVKRDGQLTSIPFCVKTGNRYRCLSGNHRVQAAEKAELTEILILYTDEELTRQEEVAIQLSHNAIVGEDDPVILQELWREIDDVGLKLYSGLDDKTMNDLAKAATAALSEMRLEFRTLSFLFLPEECDQIDAVLTRAVEQMGSADAIRLARLQEFDRVLDALARMRKDHNIRSSATALFAILERFPADYH